MNKGLEALQRIIETFYDKESEDIKCVEKELKEKEKTDEKLEIVKNKIIPLINFTMIKKSSEKNTYYTIGDNWNEDLYLSQDEFDLLKEALL